MLVHQTDGLRLYQIHRLGIAVHHVLGPEVEIETCLVIDGAMFCFWHARLDEEQIKAVEEIDGVSLFFPLSDTMDLP